jgi:threonine aldolase
MIDLRSDTVTKPTPGMREAMFSAAIGDDVYGEDETINALEVRVAAYFGKEAAIFVPSGTMSNQIAVRVHCSPGDELLCETTSHIVLWEGGGPAALSGVTTHCIDGQFGLLSVADLVGKIRPDDVHSTQTRLVWLENTHNRGGGRIQSYESSLEISKWSLENGLARHLDGARLWNTIVATGINGVQWATLYDTISVCFSKGLGAPVGSALVGTREMIKKARRYRKLFGGAMRQAGFLAGACLYALEHHVERLAEDHANAQLLADAVRENPNLKLEPDTVDTNVVWFRVDKKLGTAKELATRFRKHGVLVAPLGEQLIRLCTHLDVSRAECEEVAKQIRKV